MGRQMMAYVKPFFWMKSSRSCRSAAFHLNLDRRLILDACNGLREDVCGHRFRFRDLKPEFGPFKEDGKPLAAKAGAASTAATQQTVESANSPVKRPPSRYAGKPQGSETAMRSKDLHRSPLQSSTRAASKRDSATYVAKAHHASPRAA